MSVTSLSRVCLSTLVLFLCITSVAEARTIQWSGYTWTVRDSHGQHSNPGSNVWGSSRKNARKMADGSLRLGISKGRTAELLGPRLGYGRYRWVVQSDLSRLNAFRVIAFYTHRIHSQEPAGEQDFEFARWGDPFAPVGQYVSWSGEGRNLAGGFSVSPRPPYTLDLIWRHGMVVFSVRDGTGASLLRQGWPTAFGGRNMAPSMSYWLWPGNKWTPLAPGMRKGPHPALRVASFQHTKLKDLPHGV